MSENDFEKKIAIINNNYVNNDKYLIKLIVEDENFNLLKDLDKEKLELVATMLLNNTKAYSKPFFQYINKTSIFKNYYKNEDLKIVLHLTGNIENMMAIDLSKNKSKFLLGVMFTTLNRHISNGEAKEAWINKVFSEVPHNFWENNCDFFSKHVIDKKFTLSYKMVQNLPEELLLYYVVMNPKLIKNYLNHKGFNDDNINKIIIYSAARDYVKNINDLKFEVQEKRYNKLMLRVANYSNFINSYFYISTENNSFLNYKKFMENNIKYLVKSCIDNSFEPSFLKLSNNNVNYNLLVALGVSKFSDEQKFNIMENLISLLKDKDKGYDLLYLLDLNNDSKTKNYLNQIFLKSLNIDILSLNDLNNEQIIEKILSLQEKKYLENVIVKNDKLTKKIKF